MSKISKKLSVWMVGALVVAMLGLMACSSAETTTGDSDASEATETEAASGEALSTEGADPTSIMGIPSHAANGFTAESVAQVSTCSACHSYDSLVESGAGKLVDPDSGTEANPHFNHQYLECTDCHSVQDQSVMYCNSCHEFALPEGWVNPETDAAECAYEFDVSGLDLPDYADTGRDMTELSDEDCNGVAELEANPGLMDEVMASFMASAMGPEAFAEAAAAQAAAAEGEAPAGE